MNSNLGWSWTWKYKNTNPEKKRKEITTKHNPNHNLQKSNTLPTQTRSQTPKINQTHSQTPNINQEQTTSTKP